MGPVMGGEPQSPLVSCLPYKFASEERLLPAVTSAQSEAQGRSVVSIREIASLSLRVYFFPGCG